MTCASMSSAASSLDKSLTGCNEKKIPGTCTWPLRRISCYANPAILSAPSAAREQQTVFVLSVLGDVPRWVHLPLLSVDFERARRHSRGRPPDTRATDRESCAAHSRERRPVSARRPPP